MQDGSRGDQGKDFEILLVCSDHNEIDSLAGILNNSHCRLHQVSTCQAAISFLNKRAVAIMISEAELSDGTWKELLHTILEREDAPNLIIASQFADEHLWAEVLNAGGYDLLLRPFDSNEVKRILIQAWQDWNHKKDSRFQEASNNGKASNKGLKIAKQWINSSSSPANAIGTEESFSKASKHKHSANE